MKYKFIFVFLLLTSGVFAQSNNGLKAEEFHAQMDSLQNLKAQLLTQKDILNSEIDSLREESSELDAKLRTALRKVYRKRYGRKIGNRILDKQIWKGMTERMLRDSWGEPDRITRNKEKWGLFTQWYYGKITFYFKDRKLVDWEEKK